MVSIPAAKIQKKIHILSGICQIFALSAEYRPIFAGGGEEFSCSVPSRNLVNLVDYSACGGEGCPAGRNLANGKKIKQNGEKGF